MGSLFSSNEADQTTNQSAVGIQGASGSTSGVGSGNSGNVAANGGTAIDKISGQGNVINIQTPDIDAVHAIDHAASLSIQGGVIDTENALVANNNVSLAALAANQNVSGKALDDNSVVSLGAINANNDLSKAALGYNAILAQGAEDLAGGSINAVTGLATQSVNAAQQLAINALESVHAQSVSNSATAHDAVLAAQEIASQTAPQDQGAIAENIAATQAKTFKALAIAAGAIIGGFFLLRKTA